MSKILCIDTATDVCTVAISEGEKILSVINSDADRSHSAQLAVFIDKILKDNNLLVEDLAAVAISKGPGSYTGLRIGVSTAKGLCYGSNKPLISISTLQAMCYGIPTEFLKQNKLEDFYFAPMLDARRMEVYTTVYSSDMKKIIDVKAEILDENSFSALLAEKPVVFFGSGADKFKDIVKSSNAYFYSDYQHSARHMILSAVKKLDNKCFEDVAYFEPYYLKEFVATTPKNNILFPNKNS